MNIEKQLYFDLTKHLECEDYLVSGETFQLLHNQNLNLLITNPFPKDIDNYYKSDEYISHSEKKGGLIAYLYRLIRNYSLAKKEKLIYSFNGNKKLLDVGCGTGAFLKYCSIKGWEAFGTEPNNKARNIALKKELKVVQNLSDLLESKFSVITLWHVLEHIHNLTETISLLKDKLSKEGRLIIAVPNFESWDAKHYKEFWAAYDVPRHLWHFSKKSIRSLFSEFNMEIEKIVPMKFDSYYVSLLSERHKTGKNHFIRSFYHGWLSNLKARKEMNYSSLIYVLKNK